MTFRLLQCKLVCFMSYAEYGATWSTLRSIGVVQAFRENPCCSDDLRTTAFFQSSNSTQTTSLVVPTASRRAEFEPLSLSMCANELVCAPCHGTVWRLGDFQARVSALGLAAQMYWSLSLCPPIPSADMGPRSIAPSSPKGRTRSGYTRGMRFSLSDLFSTEVRLANGIGPRHLR